MALDQCIEKKSRPKYKLAIFPGGRSICLLATSLTRSYKSSLEPFPKVSELSRFSVSRVK